MVLDLSMHVFFFRGYVDCFFLTFIVQSRICRLFLLLLYPWMMYGCFDMYLSNSKQITFSY